ncbi:Hypothetical_protein [Hexamita inflata]|uniref:Hypothetical_protein n=1 Tax=Hexamita inflata TaxID=28002 RepID=A0AA86N8Z7_9EUKA|nr:Hypothetical protein HINF_LOCUS2922 [Hexamita inflata]
MPKSALESEQGYLKWERSRATLAGILQYICTNHYALIITSILVTLFSDHPSFPFQNIAICNVILRLFILLIFIIITFLFQPNISIYYRIDRLYDNIKKTIQLKTCQFYQKGITSHEVTPLCQETPMSGNTFMFQMKVQAATYSEHILQLILTKLSQNERVLPFAQK